jgi:hypothetical protein
MVEVRGELKAASDQPTSTAASKRRSADSLPPFPIFAHSPFPGWSASVTTKESLQFKISTPCHYQFTAGTGMCRSIQGDISLLITDSLLVYIILTRHLCGLNALEEAVVRGLLVVVLVPEQACTFARENTRNPTVLVRNTPYGHSDAAFNGNARLGDALEAVCLNLKLLLSGRCVHADIDLSVGNINTKISGCTKSSLQNILIRGGAWSSWGCFTGQMRLVTNTVNLDAVRLDKLDDALSACGLVAVEFKVVVVVYVLLAGSL